MVMRGKALRAHAADLKSMGTERDKLSDKVRSLSSDNKVQGRTISSWQQRLKLLLDR